MLKQLRIRDIILIDFAEVSFEKGFTILSGETGSGKSAILHALRLLSGERADTSVVRAGASKGIVEAVFDVENLPAIRPLLEEAGIDFASDEELHLKREISATGKGRCFINNQLAQLHVVKALGNHLLEITGQHANQKLLSLDSHRSIVDLFGGLECEALAFRKSYETEQLLHKRLAELVQTEARRLREMETLQRESEEIHSAKLREGEEEELFSEYTRLTNVEEIASKLTEVCSLLSVMGQLNRCKQTLDQLSRLDPNIQEIADTFQNAAAEIQEVSYSARNHLSRLESHPERASFINDRLALLNQIKKKYGCNIAEVHQYLASIEARLSELSQTEFVIEELQSSLKALETTNNALAASLSAKRCLAAEQFSSTMQAELRSLNMPHAEFTATLQLQERSAFGDDRLEFFFKPNVGEKEIPIRQCASGGELSRILLAIQTLLAGKDGIPTLIFDEIDANIGGETAAIVGSKLKAIGRNQQLLCVTHFPQVAKCADHHLRIFKRETEGRTLSHIDVLTLDLRENELLRMAGSL